MPEYTSVPLQTVETNQNVLFTETVVKCSRGFVVHREGAGVITLRGIVNNPSACFARYRVLFGGNIAVPDGGTAGGISLAIAINGEPIPSTEAIATPTATGAFFNVSSAIFIDVPRGCCYTVAVENTSTQEIDVQNANIIIERTA